MTRALRLARKGYGTASPNPMVGAVLVRNHRMIGEGWHRRAGQPHAEVEAIRDAEKRGNRVRGAILYVTLEPCSTTGRTPPCTEAIFKAGISRVIVGTTDPNPSHAGRGIRLLEKGGVEVEVGVMKDACDELNEAFNHWIVQRTPWVILKAAMTLDGKLATETGESKWITGAEARREGMKWRHGSDAILVGINTVLADDPELSLRSLRENRGPVPEKPFWYRVVLDSEGRTPIDARVVASPQGGQTIVVVSARVSVKRLEELSKRVWVWKAPLKAGQLDLGWVLSELGKISVKQLLVEGGGEVQGAFRDGGLFHRVVFFYAPSVLGGAGSRRAVAGEGARRREEFSGIQGLETRVMGRDWMVTGLAKSAVKRSAGKAK